MRTTLVFIAVIAGLASVAQAQITNQIISVSPATAPAGTTGLVVSLGLDTDTPPAPPAGVMPTSVTIGTVAGTGATHASQYVVTATFSIPAETTPGVYDVSVVFITPNGQLTFLRAGGFTITAGGPVGPTITGQPQPVVTIPGGSATFTVVASGTAPLRYQWQKNEEDLPGESEAALTIAPAADGDEGSYRCRVTNDHGAATSDAATLTVSSALIGAHPVVDTGQDTCYDTTNPVDCPGPGAPLHGQDAQHDGHQPHFTLAPGGAVVHDDVTGLDWQQSANINGDGTIDIDDKLTWAQLQSYPATLNAAHFGGYDDWRLPSIDELYSLIDFRGLDPSGDDSQRIPFLDTDYFAFAYGDESAGERVIDAQYASSTLYVSQASETLLFGVNFADGRIKGYGLAMPGGDKTFNVKCVRGNPLYGMSAFLDNGDGTVTDYATGLMWSRDDSGAGMDWPAALAWVAARNAERHLGHDDWRLPDVKELQSLVDYTRSPDTSGSAAIDPLFQTTSITNEGGQADFPFYWGSTTHAATGTISGGFATYVAFGRALGYMNGAWRDVHGAGAQRSDPKVGDPADYPQGHGPQGDAVRIFNFVRLVRDAASTTGGGGEGLPSADNALGLRAAPNPFNPLVTIRFEAPAAGRATLRIIDAQGRGVATVLDAVVVAGPQVALWTGADDTGQPLASGVYFARVEIAGRSGAVKLLLAR